MAHPDTRPISFTYAPVAFIWVVTLHSLFLYSDPPLPCHPSFYWLRLFSSQIFSRINTPTFSKLGRQEPAGQSRPSPALVKSTKRIAFAADQPSAFRLRWLRFFVILLSCKANARVYDAKSGYGPHSPPQARRLHLSAVAQLVEALRYKPEGRGFDFRWCHWNFSMT
jgi:hypothetical protein